jgi:hypothetical protein
MTMSLLAICFHRTTRCRNPGYYETFFMGHRRSTHFVLGLEQSASLVIESDERASSLLLKIRHGVHDVLITEIKG